MAHRLGEILLQQGVIDQQMLAAALAEQRAFGGRLGQALVDLGHVSEEQLVRALGAQLGLESIDLDHATIPPDIIHALDIHVCERYGIFPVSVHEQSRMLRVATAEPDRRVLQELAEITQKTVQPVLAPMSAIERAIQRFYYGESAPAPALGQHSASVTSGRTMDRMLDFAKSTPAPAPPSRPPPTPGSKPPPAATAPPPPAWQPATSAHQTLDSLLGGKVVELVDGAVEPPTQHAPHERELEELRRLVLRLEKTVSAQTRAFRALTDLLTEKGVLRRGELGARASRKS